MDDNKTENVAKVLLGMMQTGAFTPNTLSHKDVKLHLAKILKGWLVLSEQFSEVTSELDNLYDRLTPTERQVMRKLCSARKMSFEDLIEAAWSDRRVGYDAVERTLKNLRKKLDREVWWFEISRPLHEVKWILKAGKK